jgi:hypothetical protein
VALPAHNLQPVGGTLLGPADDQDLGSGKTFTPDAFIDGKRYRELTRREAYWMCTQHDQKKVNFDGRLLLGVNATQPLISTERMSTYVPLSQRRPSAPYRLSRAIVSAFTNFVVGEGRFPSLRVAGDDDSQDFLQTSARVGNLAQRMVYARNLGGAVGAVGLSWSFIKGKPRFQVHNVKNLYVHEWQDRESLIPRHVTECFQFTEEVWDAVEKRVVEKKYWQRRDWTMNSEVVFWPVLVNPEGGEPDWQPNTNRSVIHRDNDPHFVWIQNQPCDSPDGLPDYDGVYESLDELDTLLSVMVRGAKLNLDPTLVIKEDAIRVARMGIKKGSDNALVVDKEGGDAKYLELAGSSIEAGIKLFQEQRKTILETCECVIPDPDQVAAAATSAAAIKAIYQRMLSKGGVVQEQYGTGLQQLCEPLLYIAQARVQMPTTVVDEDGNPQEVDQSFALPKKAVPRDILGDDNQPTGEKTSDMVDRHPGAGTDVELEWPPRFPPTPADQTQIVTTASTAVGGKPVMSQQTAVEIVMGAFGRDGNEEWVKVQSDQKQDDQKEQQQLQDQAGAAGGAVGAAHQLPPGAKPKPPKPPSAGGGDGGAKDQGADEGGNP